MSMRILLVDARASAATALQSLILPAGFQQAGEVIDLEGAPVAAARHRPDVVIVHIDTPDAQPWPSLDRLQQRYPCPTLLLCARTDPNMVQRAFGQGMSAYKLSDLSAELLSCLVLAAQGHFKYHQQAVTAAKQARRALEEQRMVDRARCLLMEHYQLSEREAYARLRRLAMDRRQRLADAALALLNQAAA